MSISINRSEGRLVRLVRFGATTPFEYIKVHHNARKDANKESILIHENGDIQIPYIDSMSTKYCKESLQIWATLTKDVEPYKAYLDPKQEEFDKLLKKKVLLIKKKKDTATDIHDLRVGNDNDINNALLEKRKKGRIRRSNQIYDAEIKVIDKKIKVLVKEVADSKIESKYHSLVTQGKEHQDFHRQAFADKVSYYFKTLFRKNKEYKDLSQYINIGDIINESTKKDKSYDTFKKNFQEYCFSQSSRMKNPHFIEYVKQDDQIIEMLNNE